MLSKMIAHRERCSSCAWISAVFLTSGLILLCTY